MMLMIIRIWGMKLMIVIVGNLRRFCEFGLLRLNVVVF